MVARKKLDQWADLLLDTGKRNNLINFRDTKASTAEVLLPSPDVLFEKIDGSASFEVFDPKIVDDADDDSNVPSLAENSALNEEDLSDKKSAYVAQYTDKLKRQNQILLYNAAVNPLTASRKGTQ